METLFLWVDSLLQVFQDFNQDRKRTHDSLINFFKMLFLINVTESVFPLLILSTIFSESPFRSIDKDSPKLLTAFS